MFVSIKKILPAVAKRLGFGQQAKLNEICLVWNRILGEIFSEEKHNNKKIQPISLKNKTLFINCPSSSWANELQIKQKELIKKLNQEIGKGKIEKIRFVY